MEVNKILSTQGGDAKPLTKRATQIEQNKSHWRGKHGQLGLLKRKEAGK